MSVFDKYIQKIFNEDEKKSSYLYYMIEKCSERKNAKFYHNYRHRNLIFFHLINNEQFNRIYSLWTYLNNFYYKLKRKKHKRKKYNRDFFGMFKRRMNDFKPSIDHKDALNTLFEFEVTRHARKFVISPQNLHVITLNENICKRDWSWKAWCRRKEESDVVIGSNFLEEILRKSNKKILSEIREEIDINLKELKAIKKGRH